MTNRSEKYFSEKLISIDPSTLTLKELTAEIAQTREDMPDADIFVDGDRKAIVIRGLKE